MASRYTIILSFILATLLAAGGVELFYRSLGSLMTTDDAQPGQTNLPTLGAASLGLPPLPGSPAKSMTAKEDYSIISSRNLFGKAQSKNSTKTASKKEPVLTTTSLDLVLLGTVTGKAGDKRAFIRDKKNKNQDIYYKGDAIANALIKDILRGKIILTFNGKDEVLLMEESKSPPSSGLTPSFSMPKVVTPPPWDSSEDDPEIIEEDEPSENYPPAAEPKRRMTLKPKKQQVTE